MAIELGIIQTVVGTGAGGYTGDGGPATQALIGEAYGCAFDTAGNLYISDGRTHTIRRIDKDSGIITTVAGSGRQGYSGDGGPATEATLDNLYSLDVDTNGDIYVVDRLNAAIRKVDAATGIITTVVGTGVPGYSGDGGPGVLAQLREPNDCFLDGKGGLLIADIQDQRCFVLPEGWVGNVLGGSAHKAERQRSKNEENLLSAWAGRKCTTRFHQVQPC